MAAGQADDTALTPTASLIHVLPRLGSNLVATHESASATGPTTQNLSFPRKVHSLVAVVKSGLNYDDITLIYEIDQSMFFINSS